MGVKNAITIKEELCVGCGLCVADCPNSYLVLDGGKAKPAGPSCIECGHCFAICPENAVIMNNYDTSDCEDAVPMTRFDPDVLLAAMKSRRTVRRFLDKEVEPEKIKKIIEAGRYCQTAGNGQTVEFTILGEKQKEIEKTCVSMFRFFYRVGSVFDASMRRRTIDDNFFFKGAPLVIIVSGKGDMNRGLASSYMELMAESLGLGVLISGFTEGCLLLNPFLRSKAGLKKGHKIYSVMVIGYPAVKYRRTVPRKPAKVSITGGKSKSF